MAVYPTVCGPVQSLYRKGLVINHGEGGATTWESHGSETFCAPPRDRVKLFAPPPLLNGGNLLPPPPQSLWLKPQAPMLKLPQNFLCPPSAWLKLFLSPLFVGVKLHLPPLPFCNPPPLPVISDQSLNAVALANTLTLFDWHGGHTSMITVFV